MGIKHFEEPCCVEVAEHLAQSHELRSEGHVILFAVLLSGRGFFLSDVSVFLKERWGLNGDERVERFGHQSKVRGRWRWRWWCVKGVAERCSCKPWLFFITWLCCTTELDEQPHSSMAMVGLCLVHCGRYDGVWSLETGVQGPEHERQATGRPCTVGTLPAYAKPRKKIFLLTKF